MTRVTKYIDNMPATRSTTARLSRSSRCGCGRLNRTMVRGRKSALETQDGPETKDRCFWTLDDETHLIEFITANQAKGGDGLNFNKAFWTSACTEMAKHTTQGAVKTLEACQSKWSRVSSYLISCCISLLIYIRKIRQILNTT